MHDQPGSHANPLTTQVESSTIINALLCCLHATCNREHLVESQALYQCNYHICCGESHFSCWGLDFKGSLEQFGLVWLPADMFDWQTLFSKPEIVSLIKFNNNRL